MASVDSIHRNIAEGHNRKSPKEYALFLRYAVSSLAESISSMLVYYDAHCIDDEDFRKWDALAFKIENQLIKLIRSVEEKGRTGDWNESL